MTGLRTATGAGPSRKETLTLQQRLTDAGCYQDAIDGAKGAALDEAVKAYPDQRPVLRIETGMHTATISRVGVDGACTKLATASDDKTVRVWSLPDGRLERTIRLPIGAGNGGKVYAAALSPDGRWLAAGGWDTSYEKTNTFSLYPVHPRSRKSLGEIIRKLSVTESQNSAHLLGTSSRRNSRVVSANSPQVP